MRRSLHKDGDLWVIFRPIHPRLKREGIAVRLDTTFPEGESATLTHTYPQHGFHQNKRNQPI